MEHSPTCPIKPSILRAGSYLWLLLCLLITPISALSATTAPENKIKAAYIYQLTQFVTWPDDTLANHTLSICLLGDEPVVDELKPLHQQKKFNITFKVRHIVSIQEATSCQILYISQSNNHKLQKLLSYLSNNAPKRPILTVSSIPGFTEHGGIIGFVIIDSKVRLEINRSAALRAGIKLSAKLLEVASIIRNGDPKGTKK